MKKLLFILSLVISLTVFAASAFALSLGTAGNYNAFIFGSYSGWNSDVEGALAVGGSVSLASYSVGSSSLTTNALVAGGSLSLTKGQINGSVVLGGTASLTSATITGSLTQNAASTGIDFTAERIYLTTLSASLHTTAATGTVAYTYGGISLTGDGTSTIQIFNIDGSQLKSSNYWGTITKVPAGATLIFNVSGTADSMVSMGSSALAGYNILFNFYEATTLSVKSVPGSILAPLAAVTGDYGNIEGTVIAASWSGTTELHNVPFTGTTPVPVPAAIWLLGSGLFGLCGIRRKVKK